MLVFRQCDEIVGTLVQVELHSMIEADVYELAMTFI